MAWSGSYSAVSMADVGRAGSHGGLHTIKSADPSASKSCICTRTRDESPNRAILSAAQATARGLLSVAVMQAALCLANTAASTPLPVPMSMAVRACDCAAAWRTSSTYSPRIGENTPNGTWILACNASIHTPFFCHSYAPIKPNNWLSGNKKGVSDAVPYTACKAACTSGARGKSMR